MAEREGIPVKLGAREHRVLAQPIGRIRRRLATVASTVQALGEGGTEGIAAEGMTDELHRFLSVFIPDLAPPWELLGYSSEELYRDGAERAREAARVAERNESERAEAFAEGREPELEDEPEPFEEAEDPEAEARTPTIPQIEDAIEAIYQANGGERLVKLVGKFVGVDLVKATLTKELAGWASRRSSSSPSRNGISRSTSSSTPSPTSTESAASPSP
jgi:hypothetical protein